MMMFPALHAPRLRGPLAASLVLAGLSGAASAGMITFDTDDLGAKDDPFLSVESDRALFLANFPIPDLQGFRGQLFVANSADDPDIGALVTTTGNALFVFPTLDDDTDPQSIAPNLLSMVFPDPVDSLSLAFGGITLAFEDPLVSPSPAGTIGALIVGNLVLDGTPHLEELDQVLVPLDSAPGVDQLIAFGAPGGPRFNFAAFALVDDSFDVINATEVVDNINFTLASPVPEPGTLALAGFGLLMTAVGAARGARRCRTA